MMILAMINMMLYIAFIWHFSLSVLSLVELIELLVAGIARVAPVKQKKESNSEIDQNYVEELRERLNDADINFLLQHALMLPKPKSNDAASVDNTKNDLINRSYSMYPE